MEPTAIVSRRRSVTTTTSAAGERFAAVAVPAERSDGFESGLVLGFLNDKFLDVFSNAQIVLASLFRESLHVYFLLDLEVIVELDE